MCLMSKLIEELNEHLTGSKYVSGNIIRKHSKKLDQLGDISFPLNIKNWSQIISKSNVCDNEECTIFEYLSSDKNLDNHLQHLVIKSKEWTLGIDKCDIKSESDVHVYLNRPFLIQLCVKDVIKLKSTYGIQHKCFNDKVSITSDNSANSDESFMTLTELRLKVAQNVLSNVVNSVVACEAHTNTNIKISLNSNEKRHGVLICGSVLNENGVKDSKTTAAELYKKRALDMQLMAQHKYGIQVKPHPAWIEYFEKLGRASVTLEMLQNRLHKTIKVSLNNLQGSNKGSSFIFYNCARLSALLKEFNNRVLNKVYPHLPSIDEIDFSLLNQSEEWELVYVYILQFPLIVSSCVCDINSGIVSPHILVLFLSNLCSLFSTYYRRVKILTNSKEHLLPVLFARMYLLMAIQQVFHTALNLLDIEPVKEM